MTVIIRTSAQITGSVMATPGFTSLWWVPGTVGGSTADASDCLDRFRDIWGAFSAHISNQLTFIYDPICVAVEATTGVLTGAFAGTLPGPTAGGGAGDALPRQTQGLGRLSTSSVIGGRRVRGRLFLPGPLEADNTSAGVPSSTYVSDAVAAVASILPAGATASAPCIWHRPTGGAGGASPLITGVSASPSWSVLRSRRA